METKEKELQELKEKVLAETGLSEIALELVFYAYKTVRENTQKGTP